MSETTVHGIQKNQLQEHLAQAAAASAQAKQQAKATKHEDKAASKPLIPSQPDTLEDAHLLSAEEEATSPCACLTAYWDMLTNLFSSLIKLLTGAGATEEAGVEEVPLEEVSDAQRMTRFISVWQDRVLPLPMTLKIQTEWSLALESLPKIVQDAARLDFELQHSKNITWPAKRSKLSEAQTAEEREAVWTAMIGDVGNQTIIQTVAKEKQRAERREEKAAASASPFLASSAVTVQAPQAADKSACAQFVQKWREIGAQPLQKMTWAVEFAQKLHVLARKAAVEAFAEHHEDLIQWPAQRKRMGVYTIQSTQAIRAAIDKAVANEAVLNALEAWANAH